MTIGSETLVEIAVIILVGVIAFALGYAIAAARKETEKRFAVQSARADSTKRQRSTVGGQIAESLRPYIGDFHSTPAS